ncbi:unnamed protein product [Rhizophagus irregularis]|nr:unnamed protein product [Rhizophagus irregularis]
MAKDWFGGSLMKNDLDDQENYLFQEDNVPMHTARIVKSWKEENEVDSIPWPIQSPDLSTIGRTREMGLGTHPITKK